ncbi:MAG: selenium-dependent xanthine dehydrogenase [Calditrichales bacterium]|nr:MAG: selenium-dependent xanthine dehydrogenase [Calditrichales bacterium]
MNFLLNGSKKTYTGDPALSLLYYLRENALLISPKDGCAPQAACGACTVELNGESVLSCSVPMAKVAGGHVITTEGLDLLVQNAFIVAFAEKGAVQCGFCTPGIVMSAKTLFDKYPDPTRQQIKRALKNNLCRCTGYKKIIDAIEYAAEIIRMRKFVSLPAADAGVGKRHIRYDVEKLVLGQRPFVADLRFENMVHAALKFSDHPRAKVIAVDSAAAEKMAGVVRVFTANDIPGQRYIGLIHPDWPVMIDRGETTYYIGNVIAGVVAESEAIARAAVKKIKVTYEVLKPVSDVAAAMSAESASVHHGKSNILETCHSRFGNVEKAFNESTHRVRRQFQTQTIEHGYLEPEACIARPQGDGIEVYSQTQGIYEDQRQISEILNLPKEKINVRLVPNGGGFGGKEDLSVQGHTALFAWLIKRPVKLVLNREESLRMHPKRHPVSLNYELACDREGNLTALKAEIIGDTGAHASVGSKVMERAVGHSTGAYSVPNVDVKSYTVYTNNIPNGAMRGFGVNQATFAMETCVDELCALGGFDPWEFRYRNALTEGKVTATGQVLTGGVGVRKTLEAIRPYYEKAEYKGLACGIKNTGIGNGMNDESYARVEIVAKDKVCIHHGWTEMGQGVNTIAIQTVCQETGLSAEIIEVIAETRSETPAGMTTASRATSLLGNALIDACVGLRKDLKEKNLDDLCGKAYTGHWVCDWTTKPGTKTDTPVTHYSYSYASQLVLLDQNGKIDKVIAAHDAGRIMNPTLFEGQIEGSVHMGLGYALSEEFIQEESIPKSYRLRSCGILRAADTPEVQVIGVEVADPVGPYGAKGVGEIGLVPTAPAVANAFFTFDKKRRYTLPIKDYNWKKSQIKLK